MSEPSMVSVVSYLPIFQFFLPIRTPGKVTKILDFDKKSGTGFFLLPAAAASSMGKVVGVWKLDLAMYNLRSIDPPSNPLFSQPKVSIKFSLASPSHSLKNFPLFFFIIPGQHFLFSWIDSGSSFLVSDVYDAVVVVVVAAAVVVVVATVVVVVAVAAKAKNLNEGS